MSARSSVEVRIDRLVLDGLSVEPHHARRVRTAVELELARLLGGTPSASFAAGAVPHVAAPAMAHGPGDSPETTGSRIASAVHSAIVARGGS